MSMRTGTALDAEVVIDSGEPDVEVVWGVAVDVPTGDGSTATRVFDHICREFAQIAVDHRVPWRVDGHRASGHRIVSRLVPALGR